MVFLVFNEKLVLFKYASKIFFECFLFFLKNTYKFSLIYPIC